MDTGALTRIVLGTWIASSGFAMLHEARAEPPLQKVSIALNRESRTSHDSAAPPLSAPLDLRPPLDLQTTNATAAATTRNAISYGRTQRSWADESGSSDGSHTAAASHTTAAAESTHIMSPLQNLAHNFRQEGLPVAKLFQSDESLVHLGLNSKGKPGLWFMHRLH